MRAGAVAESGSEGEGGAEEVLRFEAVTRRFDGAVVVDAIELALRRGEILALLGPSGCGKTTTLRMAIGLERSSAGRIMHGGVAVDAPAERIFAPPERRNMGIVFQSYAVWPHLSVFENVAFPLRTRKVAEPEIEARVRASLARVGMQDFAERPGGKLSGGQQQRVAIARSLVYEPQVLLLDEPFSNLDAHLRHQVRRDLRQLQRELGLSILFVTHDQAEALAISDRVAIMRAGRIEQIGAPQDLYERPQTPFVRDFLGRWVKLAAAVDAVRGGETHVALADGATIVALQGGHAPGARVLVAVRPERIAFVADDGRAPRNAIAATIRALHFLGDQYEAELAFASGETAHVFLPAVGGWREGQTIRLELAPEAIHLWPAEEA
ncbi:MAG: ABC transporter ATP-binding protein [Hyphomonadaceae bacterium]|nr:ABC transporter ATP-binding protein [Hyphomonadaceae bacterium]